MVKRMQSILNQVQEWNGTLVNLYALIKEKDERLLLTNNNGVNPLQVWDLLRTSVAYFLVLSARLQDNQPDLLGYCLKFAKCVNYQHLGPLGKADVKLFAERLIKYGHAQSRKGLILVLKYLCIGFSQGGYFTEFHTLFVKECLIEKTFRVALDVLVMDLDHYDTKKFMITAQDILMYHYYSGLLWAGLKEWSKATASLLFCLLHPAQVTSGIQIEAYKRLILIQLLMDGKMKPLPKSLGPVVSKTLKHGTILYSELSRIYESGQVVKFQQKIEADHQLFEKDGTVGLVKQCLVSMVTFKIQKLTQTYLTLSLDDVARSIGPEALEVIGDPERHILKMVELGKVYALISHQDNGKVSFKERPEDYDTIETSKKLDQQIQALFLMGQKVQGLNKEIGLSKDFLARTQHDKMGIMDDEGFLHE